MNAQLFPDFFALPLKAQFFILLGYAAFAIASFPLYRNLPSQFVSFVFAYLDKTLTNEQRDLLRLRMIQVLMMFPMNDITRFRLYSCAFRIWMVANSTKVMALADQVMGNTSACSASKIQAR
jgi:hypothetical protein